MIFDIRDQDGLVASCSDRATALLLARQWLREPAQQHAGTHTCVLQIRDDENHLLADHIVALCDGPSAANPEADAGGTARPGPGR